MRNAILMLAATLLLMGCGKSGNENTDSASALDDKLVTTTRGDHVDTYFGVEVPDPYRWLEDDLSEDTADWIADQMPQPARILTLSHCAMTSKVLWPGC